MQPYDIISNPNGLCLSMVLIHSRRFLSNGLDKVLVDEEDELEAGDFQHGVVVETHPTATTNL